MPRMFSYVVQHDTGLAPNPEDGICTLAVCKFGSPEHRNIVELAEVGDWIIGTGGADLRTSSGHGTLVYAMRVDENISLQAYKRDDKYRHRQDALFAQGHIAVGRRTLISSQYSYFGRDAIPIPSFATDGLQHDFEKRGPGFRSDFDSTFIATVAEWIDCLKMPGRQGEPCCPHHLLNGEFSNCGEARPPC